MKRKSLINTLHYVNLEGNITYNIFIILMWINRYNNIVYLIFSKYRNEKY